jgi:hypothetical protein
MLSQSAVDRSLRTIAAYEDYAPQYNMLVSPTPSPDEEAGLHRLEAIVGPGGSVLEIGSGPGYDADYLESRGLLVRRTDATSRFLRLQAERGRHGELVNVLTDELGGPYDGVLAHCVLIHIEYLPSAYSTMRVITPLSTSALTRADLEPLKVGELPSC